MLRQQGSGVVSASLVVLTERPVAASNAAIPSRPIGHRNVFACGGLLGWATPTSENRLTHVLI